MLSVQERTCGALAGGGSGGQIHDGFKGEMGARCRDSRGLEAATGVLLGGVAALSGGVQATWTPLRFSRALTRAWLPSSPSPICWSVR